MLNGLNLRLVFNRASSQFCIISNSSRSLPNDERPKIKIQDICIFARKVKVNPEILKVHNDILKLGKAIYPIKRTLVKVLNLPSSQTTFYLDNVFLGQLPRKIIIGLVSNDAYSGTYILNPFYFNNYDLSYLCIHVNGEAWPKTPYQPNYRNGEYSREYYELFSNLGTIPAIDYEYFANSACLYAFNFNSDYENQNEEDYISLPKNGFLNIEIKFRSSLSNSLKLICYAQFDNQIEVDESRNVIIDY